MAIWGTKEKAKTKKKENKEVILDKTNAGRTVEFRSGNYVGFKGTLEGGCSKNQSIVSVDIFGKKQEVKVKNDTFYFLD